MTLIGRIGALVAALVVVAVAGVYVFGGGPVPVATAFVRALPYNAGALRVSAPALAKNRGFQGYIRRWQARDAALGWREIQGPVYVDVVSQDLLSAKVYVVSHYAERDRAGGTVNWEQDFAISEGRSLAGWHVTSVRTTGIALVDALASLRPSGPTALIVPPQIYLPEGKR